jgi:hypothetical protein
LAQDGKKTIHDVEAIAFWCAPLALFVACGGSSLSPVANDRGAAAASAGPSGYGYEFAVDTVEKVTAAAAPLGRDRRPLGPHGRLPPEAIEVVVRGHFGATLSCYDIGRRKNPSLAGVVRIKFVIGEDGFTKQATDEGSTLPDKEVIDCIVADFKKRHFPESHGGDVTVIYPIQLGS